MKQLNFQLLVDGTDLTDYVVSMERNHSFCNPIASLDLVLAPNLPIAIKPYQDILFYEDADKTFTGYSQEEVAARLPVEVSMRCNDVLIRAQDTWFTGPLVADGESAIAWIKKFLNKAGIRKISVGVSENYAIYPGYGWEFSTCLDAIVGCMQQCPYRVFADGDGIVHIDQARRGAVEHTINEYASYDRVTNDCWIRNRAVVYGNGFVADKQTANPYLLPNEVRAAIVATGQIHQMSTADAIASRMLSEFSEPLDIKVIELEGSPDYKINQIVDFTDPGTGYHRSDCLITGINTIMNAEDGYVTEITLDEKCVSFWGWDVEPPPPLPKIYTAMTDSGVYRSDWDYLQPNCNWVAYNEGLAGSALTVHDLKISDHNTLWIATAGGLYRRPKDNNTWARLSLPEPEEGLGEPEPVAIYLSKLYKRTIYVLTRKEATNRAWLYLTKNAGRCWTILELSHRDLYAIREEWAIGPQPHDVWEREGNEIWDNIEGPDEKLALVWFAGKLRCGCFENLNADGGVWTWDDPNWNKETNNHYVTDLLVRNDGHLAVLAAGNCVLQGYIRIYTSGWFLNSSITLPNNGVDWYWSLGELDNTLFIGSRPCGGGFQHNYIRRWNGIAWIEEWDLPGDGGNYVRNFVEYENQLWAAVEDKKRLLIRDRYLGTWSWDTLEAPRNIVRVLVHKGEIHIICTGSRIYKRDTYYGWVQITSGITTMFNGTCDGTYAGQWYIMDQRGMMFRWDDIADEWVKELEMGPPNPRKVRIFASELNNNLKIPVGGRTHLLDASADEEHIYIAALTVFDKPIFLRVKYDLSDDAYTMYKPGVGTWGGVKADPYISERIWVHGDFGPKKLRLSENYGSTWTDKASGLWGGGENVRAMVSTFSAATDYVAILNAAEEAWATQTDGDLWSKAADLTFPANFGRDLLDGMGIFIGDEGADADILRHSKRDGKNWTEQSTGLPIGKRMANVVEEIDYI